jgi:hypothetical protein
MEKRTMKLTKKILNDLLQSWRIQIPANLEKELLANYGNLVVTEDGRVIEYSEQDICEQLRKIIRPYQEPGELPDDVAQAFSRTKH